MNLSKDISKSYSNRMFGTVIMLFLLFAGCFLIYQGQREKQYRVDMLDQQLGWLNEHAHHYLKHGTPPDSLPARLADVLLPQCRITIIDKGGAVVYDSETGDLSSFGNHLQRQEISEARRSGHGYDIRRESASVGGEFFYSANWYPAAGYYVRSAMPYDIRLIDILRYDQRYIFFAVAVFVILGVVLFLFNRRLGVYREIKEMQDALLVERDKLLAHLRISQEGLGIFSPERKTILVNPRFTKYTDIITDSNLANIEDFLEVEEFSAIRQFLDESDAGGIGGERVGIGGERRTKCTVSKAGRTFSVSCVIFLDHSFEVSINDITDHDWRTNLKRQMTQNISHELRTPVSGIQGYLETIMQAPNLDSDHRSHFIERAYSLCIRLTNMLRDIATLTKMDETSGAPEMRQMDLHDTIAEVIADMTDEIESRNMAVELHLPDSIPLKGNASLLYSVFRNLVENSVAYAGNNSTISIGMFRHDLEYYYFSYADNGVGVSEEHLPRLFERFYRVDKGRSRKQGGTGLGLAIVKNAILLHGGSISAKKHAGQGLEFIFTLRAPYDIANIDM